MPDTRCTVRLRVRLSKLCLQQCYRPFGDNAPVQKPHAHSQDQNSLLNSLLDLVLRRIALISGSYWNAYDKIPCQLE